MEKGEPGAFKLLEVLVGLRTQGRVIEEVNIVLREFGIRNRVRKVLGFLDNYTKRTTIRERHKKKTMW